MSKFLKFMSFCFVFIFLLIFSLYINQDTVIADSFPFTGIINADALIMKDSASSRGNQVTQIVYGSRVSVIGESGSYYKVSYDGKTGFVYKSYVVNVENNIKTNNISSSDTYDNYCNSLVNKGFDRTYCPYLYYLHSKYPNWTFTADRVGISIDEASNNEQWKVVLQSNNQNYWLSNKAAEADYYYINSNTISSFMDPRNSLFEKTIFQFLDFKSSKSIYNDASLGSAIGKGDSYFRNYYLIFGQAGVDYSVNPLHLISRSIQETGGKSTFNGITGRYSTDLNTTYNGNTLNGYYNFYNINAYAGNGLGAIGNGLAYAAGYVIDSKEADGSLTYLRPWNSPEQAIKGGAKFIAEAYTHKGQNTNYFEKFNVSTYSGYAKYSHQYMTNAYAPAGESFTLFNAYNAGNQLNSNFNFIIPVYENMGSNAYQAINRSSDSSLSDIKIDGKTISGFDKVRTEYDINIQTNNNYIDVGATCSDSKCNISGTGRINFVNGYVTVNILVKAEDGSTSNYVIRVKQVTVAKVSIDEILSKLAVKVNGNNMYGISPGTQVGTLVNTVVNNGGQASVKSSNGSVKTSGNLVTGDIITITGATTASYTISVKGDINGDGVVKINDLILVQSHILGKTNLTGEKFYAADISGDGSIKINDLVMIQSHILGKSNL